MPNVPLDIAVMKLPVLQKGGAGTGVTTAFSSFSLQMTDIVISTIGLLPGDVVWLE